MSPVLALILSALATWRLCHLVASEDGPFGTIVMLRRAAANGQLGRLMDCPYCLSLWFAGPFAVWVAHAPVEGVVFWLAISGGACLIEQLSAVLRTRAEPSVIDLPPAQ